MTPINVVSGLGRCGTSLVMQMLDAAGLDVVVGNGPPAYEADEQLGLVVTEPGQFRPESVEWLDALHGRFVKLLDPFRMQLPDGDYRVLWIDRDYEEQARSQVKLLVALGSIPAPSRPEARRLRKAFAAQLPRDRAESLRLLNQLGVDLQMVTFEALVRGGLAVDQVATFFGHPLLADRMRCAIVPRPPACLPYLLETTLPHVRPGAVVHG